MSYYLVKISYVSKNTEQLTTIRAYDMGEEFVRKDVTDPFIKGNRFVLLGRVIYPDLVEEINVYKTKKPIENYRSGDVTINNVLDRIESGELGNRVTPGFITPMYETSTKEKQMRQSKDVNLEKLRKIAKQALDNLRNYENDTLLDTYPSKLAEFKNLITNSQKALPDHNTYFKNILSQTTTGIEIIDVRYAIMFILDAIDLDKDEQTGNKQQSTAIVTNVSLMKSAKFLDLDVNWSLTTCALQLQEVAITLVAKERKIKLDKANVEKLLNKKIQNFSFNHKYEAFSKYVKDSLNIKMPILATQLRRMRVKVLHEGYNPNPEETESIVSFTIGLLEKLERINKANMGKAEKL